MRLIIAGSRSIVKYQDVYDAMELVPNLSTNFLVTEVVSGGARGVDQLGEEWARLRHLPIKRFTPNWDKFGRVAGFYRNAEMAEYADALIAVWDGVSNGTGGMIMHMQRLYKPVGIWTPKL